MKLGIIIIASVFTLALSSCSFFYNPPLQPQSSAVAQASPIAGQSANPSSFKEFKDLFFADQSLEELVGKDKVDKPAQDGDPWRLYALALANSRQGKVEEAKRNLRQVLALPQPETRWRLWAWKALRELGEKLPANIANEVHGVVFELHNEAGVGTIAAYSDGRARWLGSLGKIIVWEAPGTDSEVDKLIRDFLKSAEPLVKGTPIVEKHKSIEPPLNYVRVSILTYGGIHIAEAHGPEIDEQPFMSTVLIASVQLLDALGKKSDEENRKSNPR